MNTIIAADWNPTHDRTFHQPGSQIRAPYLQHMKAEVLHWNDEEELFLSVVVFRCINSLLRSIHQPYLRSTTVKL